jgi:RNA polymerase sigma-70 factor (ECF subfamily)
MRAADGRLKVSATGESAVLCAPMVQPVPRSRLAEGQTDEALMARAQEGCEAAFDALIRRHYKQVANFAARMTGRPDLAPDIAQHVFALVFEKRSRYRRGHPFRPWLYIIARRRCRKVLREESRTVAGDAVAAQREAEHSDPGQAAERRETLRGLRAALTQLPERERAAVVMFHYLQWPYNEIAAALGSSSGAARTAACRGRARLRRLLAAFEEGEGG